MAKVWGHRGASGYAPENTMEAFALAVEMGAHGIELDVQMSADGRLIVCHDACIDRTSNGSGAIAALSYEKLAQYNYHAGFSAETFYHLPLLEEVLELLKPTQLHLNIELKCDSLVRYDGMEVKVVQAVRQAGMEERVIYSSFDHYCLRRLKYVAPFAKTGILYDACLYQPWDYAKTLQATALHPHYASLFEPLIIDQAHREGLEVNTWTVNDSALVRTLGLKGVDGIITNDPDMALTALREADCLD
jgi:glycerophosphoryl diester phosphodiesterase